MAKAAQAGGASKPKAKNPYRPKTTLTGSRPWWEESSSNLAEIIYFSRDFDCRHVRTGTGFRRRKCSGKWCQHPTNGITRKSPRIDFVRVRRDLPRREAIYLAKTLNESHRQFFRSRWPLQPDAHGPPPPPIWLCTDCRTIAREAIVVVGDMTVVRGVRLERIDVEYRGEYGGVPFVSTEDYDGSPHAATVDLMADAEKTIKPSRLPTEDVEQLRHAIAAYNATGNIDDFVCASGDESIAREQRHKYAATKTLIV